MILAQATLHCSKCARTGEVTLRAAAPLQHGGFLQFILPGLPGEWATVAGKVFCSWKCRMGEPKSQD